MPRRMDGMGAAETDDMVESLLKPTMTPHESIVDSNAEQQRESEAGTRHALEMMTLMLTASKGQCLHTRKTMEWMADQALCIIQVIPRPGFRKKRHGLTKPHMGLLRD